MPTYPGHTSRAHITCDSSHNQSSERNEARIGAILSLSVLSTEQGDSPPIFGEQISKCMLHPCPKYSASYICDLKLSNNHNEKGKGRTNKSILIIHCFGLPWWSSG